FADLYEVSKRTIQSWLEQLEVLGFIQIEYGDDITKHDRKIRLCDTFKNVIPMKKTSPPHEENFTHNRKPNTSSLSTYNTTLPPSKKIRKNKVQGEVVFPKEKTEKIPKKIYECLEKIAISQNSKERLTEQYSEEVVKKSLRHVTHPKFKVKDSFEGSIFYFSKEAYNGNPLNPTKEMREHDAVKILERKEELRLYLKHHSQVLRSSISKWAIQNGHKWQEITPEVHEQFIEFKNPRTEKPEKIYFDNPSFKEQCRSFMRKLEIEIPDWWK
ncbi:MAG TPA: hypothetical protein VKZ44_05355, partial [Taishania sp.]|nr:hypothetical protein [Taishania sp.]